MGVCFAVALILAVTAALALSLRALGSTGVPVRASTDDAIAAALDLLELEPGDHLVDLGCGQGDVLLAARRRADVTADGYELNPSVALLAALRGLTDSKLHVRFGDSRQADLSAATALYAYLMPRAMTEWAPKLAALKSGTRIVSVDFELPGWTAKATRTVGPLAQPVRLYVVQ
ncbi:MAG: class I SAM-dependent methyltransferase [Myxococcaceae bacterium]